jgi:hypothetical protein
MGLMGSLIFGTTFFDNGYQAFRGDQAIWWTPQAMRLPIEETSGPPFVYGKTDYPLDMTGTG